MTKTKQNGMGEHSYGSKVKSRPLFLQRGYGNKEYVRYIPIQRGLCLFVFLLTPK